MSNILSLQSMTTPSSSTIAVGESTSSGTACTCSTSSFNSCGKTTTPIIIWV